MEWYHTQECARNGSVGNTRPSRQSLEEYKRLGNSVKQNLEKTTRIVLRQCHPTRNRDSLRKSLQDKRSASHIRDNRRSPAIPLRLSPLLAPGRFRSQPTADSEYTPDKGACGGVICAPTPLRGIGAVLAFSPDTEYRGSIGLHWSDGFPLPTGSPSQARAARPSVTPVSGDAQRGFPLWAFSFPPRTRPAFTPDYQRSWRPTTVESSAPPHP